MRGRRRWARRPHTSSSDVSCSNRAEFALKEDLSQRRRRSRLTAWSRPDEVSIAPGPGARLHHSVPTSLRADENGCTVGPQGRSDNSRTGWGSWPAFGGLVRHVFRPGQRARRGYRLVHASLLSCCGPCPTSVPAAVGASLRASLARSSVGAPTEGLSVRGDSLLCPTAPPPRRFMACCCTVSLCDYLPHL